ncbi:hypothetical protein G7046_g3078 [Stylonectria norvegica]|nr:hypothetical protein G7046_g3078 [Stylonectria norvegica]
MRLFLVRHGETVDNVAGLYAGSRDSVLTTHGVLQARRLASHLASNVRVKHIFSSHLQRAVKTAEAVCESQKRAHALDLSVVQLAELREKDFGSGEGAKFGAGKTDAKTGGHLGAESADAMRTRVDRFLDDHLFPVLCVDEEASVCVIAHGIILGVLFNALCARIPTGAITVAPEAQSVPSGPALLHPAWSNTGYLEGVFSALEKKESERSKSTKETNLRSLDLKFHVESVNCLDHVKGLRKTRGGIGSAKFDDKQKTMDSFFKPASRKRKLEEDDQHP